MTHIALLVQLCVTVGVMLGLAVLTIVGWSRFGRSRLQYRERMRVIVPYLVLLGGVLLLNNATRKLAPEVSWVIGWNITGIIYATEGTFVAALQSIIPSLLTPFFSFMYVYGYVFLLVFPLIAYFAHEDLQPMRETCLAYTLNYAIGLLCYVLIIAYGPRNLLPDLVEPLLYVNWPQSQLLTSQVNTNTNVFPSLHSALSITVVLFAYRTRQTYPAWLAVAVFCAGSILLSTMYLGIHWLIDVLAGGLLAILAVLGATTLEPRYMDRYRSRLANTRASMVVGRWMRVLQEKLKAVR